MNKLTPLIIFYLFLTQVQAQDDLAIGLYGGTSQYMGDLNKMNPLFSPAPAFGFGIKSDQNLRYSFQLLGSYNPIKGSAKYAEEYRLYELADRRDDIKVSSFFFRHRQVDLSLTAEFNFLPYESYNPRKRNLTPYVFAGIGTSYLPGKDANEFPVTIPFGLGIKYNIFERFSVGIKWMAKKIFYDDMDGISNISDHDNQPRIHNDDWYHHGFLFVTFKPFRKQIDCPTYEE